MHNLHAHPVAGKPPRIRIQPFLQQLGNGCFSAPGIPTQYHPLVHGHLAPSIYFLLLLPQRPNPTNTQVPVGLGRFFRCLTIAAKQQESPDILSCWMAMIPSPFKKAAPLPSPAQGLARQRCRPLSPPPLKRRGLQSASQMAKAARHPLPGGFSTVLRFLPGRPREKRCPDGRDNGAATPPAPRALPRSSAPHSRDPPAYARQKPARGCAPCPAAPPDR